METHYVMSFMVDRDDKSLNVSNMHCCKQLSLGLIRNECRLNVLANSLIQNLFKTNFPFYITMDSRVLADSPPHCFTLPVCLLAQDPFHLSQALSPSWSLPILSWPTTTPRGTGIENCSPDGMKSTSHLPLGWSPIWFSLFSCSSRMYNPYILLVQKYTLHNHIHHGPHLGPQLHMKPTK